MALLDALLTNGGSTDSGMADSGTALNLLRQKWPAMFAAADAPAPPVPAMFNSAAPTPNTATPVDPSSIPAPDIAPPAFENRYNLPWLPGFKAQQQAQLQRPPISTPTGQWAPGTNKAQKLEVMLRDGLQGAIAGYGASANAVVQSGGRRSGGFGLGAAAGYEAPIQQAAQQQAFQRGGLENQLLSTQVQYAPQIQALNFGRAMADIQKNLADADKATAEAGKASAETGAIPMKSALESAQALAARYKEDPGSGQLIDLQTGQPFGNSAGLAPLSAEEATILGKQEGDRVPLKLKNTASEIVNRGVHLAQGGGRSLLVDSKGNTIKDLGVATPLATINAQMNATAPVTPQMRNAVDMVGKGQIDLATALGPFRRFPGASESFLADLESRYPNYNQATYGVSKKTMEYFTTGKGGEELNAFRTAISHADLLEQAAVALGNKDMKLYNSLANKLVDQFGDPRPTNFQTIANAYTREVTKAVSAGHITNNEVETQGATMPQNASLAQIRGAAQAYRSLMSSKAQQRMIQYEQGLQGKAAFPDFGGGNTGGMPAGATMKVPGSDGKLHWSDGKQDLGVAQ